MRPGRIVQKSRNNQPILCPHQGCMSKRHSGIEGDQFKTTSKVEFY